MKTSTLVDSNVLIDVLAPAAARPEWSARMLERRLNAGTIIINTIIWSELAASVRNQEALEEALLWLNPRREFIPWNAAFSAGLAHWRYRRAGGARERTLPDFLIGAHAATSEYSILTRDPARYRTYFPDLEIIAPDTDP